MRPCEASSARSRRTRMSAACVRARSTAASTMSSTRSVALPSAGHSADSSAPSQPHVGQRADPGRREAGLDEQRLDALLVERRPAPRAGRWRRARARRRRPRSAAQALRLAFARGRLDPRRGRAPTSSALACSTSMSSRPARRSRRYGCRWDSKAPASSAGAPTRIPAGRSSLELARTRPAPRGAGGRRRPCRSSAGSWPATSRPGRGGRVRRPDALDPPRAPRPDRRRAAPRGG